MIRCSGAYGTLQNEWTGKQACKKDWYNRLVQQTGTTDWYNRLAKRTGNMVDLNRYLTDENREGIRRFYEKYLGTEEMDREAVDSSYWDIVIETITADVFADELDERCLEKILAKLAKDPDSDVMYAAALDCLRYSTLVYFERKDRNDMTYPLLPGEPDEMSGQEDESGSIFPLYTRRSNAKNPALRPFHAHRAGFEDILPIIASSGCRDIVINPDTEGFLFSLDDVMACLSMLDDILDTIGAVLSQGVEESDLFPALNLLLDCTDVECILQDGQVISGTLVLPRVQNMFDSKPETDANPDSFTIVPHGSESDEEDDYYGSDSGYDDIIGAEEMDEMDDAGDGKTAGSDVDAKFFGDYILEPVEDDGLPYSEDEVTVPRSSIAVIKCISYESPDEPDEITEPLN